jgi:hypothetical protein
MGDAAKGRVDEEICWRAWAAAGLGNDAKRGLPSRQRQGRVRGGKVVNSLLAFTALFRADKDRGDLVEFQRLAGSRCICQPIY